MEKEESWKTNKNIPPFPVEENLEEDIGEDGLIEVSNPYSGQSCRLSRVALAVYDSIKGADDILRAMDHPISPFKDWPKAAQENLMKDSIRKHGLGIEWFMIHYPEEYYILID